MPELNKYSADRLSTLESRAQQRLDWFNYSLGGLIILIVLILADAILTTGPIWPPFFWLGGGVLVAAFLAHRIAKSATETYLNDLIETVEHGSTNASLETIEDRKDSLETHLETAESLAEGLKDDELQDRVAGTRYRFDRWWIETLLTRAEGLERESRELLSQDNSAAALDAVNDAWTLYIRAASAVTKCDDDVFYDPSIAAALGIDVPDDGLTTLEGVGSERLRRLRNAGFETIPYIRRAEPEDLAKLESIGEATAAKIIDSVEAYPIDDRLEEKRTELKDRVTTLEATVAEAEDEVDGSTRAKTSGDPSQASSVATATAAGTSNGSESTAATGSKANPAGAEARSDTKVKSKGLTNALERIESWAEPDGQVIDHVEEARQVIQSDGEPPDRQTLIQVHNTLGVALSLAQDGEDPEVGEWLEGVLDAIEAHLDDAADQRAEATAQDTESPESTPEQSGERSKETVPDEEVLLAELRRIAENKPEAITRGDVWAKGRFEPALYESVFGSWEAAVEAAAVEEEETVGGGASNGESEPSDADTGNGRQRSPTGEPVEIDQSQALADLPEGRIDSLVVEVEAIDERHGNVRDRELTVVTAGGERLQLTIWTTHDVSIPWTEGERYELADVRHKVWDTGDDDASRQHALSSTRDMTASRIERRGEGGFEFVGESSAEESEEADTEEPESEEDVVTRLMKDMEFEENQ